MITVIYSVLPPPNGFRTLPTFSAVEHYFLVLPPGDVIARKKKLPPGLLVLSPGDVIAQNRKDPPAGGKTE